MARIDRRELLRKLGSAGTLAALSATAPGIASSALGDDQTRQWEIFEIGFAGPSSGNPFVDVTLTATFRMADRRVTVDGFYDGGGRYRLRFMPDRPGRWSYVTESNVPSLRGLIGDCVCVAPAPAVHGPVSVCRQSHFAYADGTPFFPFGTTCYAWTHQSDALQRQTLQTLRTSPFNKIRMCVFPKHYEYNHNEPSLYPFERDAAGANDYSRFNPAFFAHLEHRIQDLAARGIEADLILFHPYDRWGYASMPPEADDRYLRYLLARLSAHRNVWWSIANEWDLMKSKSVQDFDRFFHLVEQHDPVGHLRSVHYSRVMYDYAHPWVTHASLQTTRFESAAEWLDAWHKPVVFDEVMYEGNLNRRWGNLSGEECLRRFWQGVVAGCYVTHGECFLDPARPFDESATPTLWWSHGGTLHGTSPQRIAFLRKIVEDVAGAGRPGARCRGLQAQPGAYYPNASIVDPDSGRTEAILYYMDFHQPVYYEFPLPEGRFRADLIDPWQMTVTSLSGTFSGKTSLTLTGRPYQAVLLRRV
jgi:Domain of unknown function (DUF5060)/Protein of unknown function (DUF4038)/Domain of unknown function (DUF5605)